MNQTAFKASQLAAHVNGRLFGEGDTIIHRIAALDTAGAGEIAYFEDQKFLDAAKKSKASCLITPTGSGVDFPCRIEVSNPKLAFALTAEVLHPPQSRDPSIDGTAVISKSADIALTAYIGPHVFIGENTSVGVGSQILSGVGIGNHVVIGSDCVIHPNVVIYDNVTLGDRVVLHAGSVIGADGFGYVRDDMSYHKFPQIGTVVIDSDVEIGANSCVDRAALGETRIGRGTKLDNMVHVGHNCEIGERVVIAAQTGISGSVVIEADCVIGGQVGFGDHIRVQSGAIIGSKAGVLPGKIVRPGVWWGIPIQPLDEYKRLNAHIGRLPHIRQQLKELTDRLKEVERELQNRPQ